MQQDAGTAHGCCVAAWHARKGKRDKARGAVHLYTIADRCMNATYFYFQSPRSAATVACSDCGATCAGGGGAVGCIYAPLQIGA
jgi:hypothetical protein